jgi:hypothetical protein
MSYILSQQESHSSFEVAKAPKDSGAAVLRTVPHTFFRMIWITLGVFGVNTLFTWGVQVVKSPNFFLGNGSR